MSHFNYSKYKAATAIEMPARRWPDQQIKKAPQWCSVDLRDGNQALVNPMSVSQKIGFFELLLSIGFKQIEVGFPAASQPDYEFVRRLIDENRIPDDVTIQVLTQARAELIDKTFRALQGVKRAIVHVYNSTSTVQREQVFQLDRTGIIAIAVNGAKLVKQHALAQSDTEWQFQYSPESFTGTEMDFAVEICDAVIDVWQPTPARPAIINLPATVEMTTPNVYADQIEWFCDHIARRKALIISVHTHNDRGCAVAASELAVMAGADRVEGTLLGNGERTGNLDIITMAMNLYSQGIDPQLDFSNASEIISRVKEYTQLPVHPRHPYVGELVYTAFSGSHQDAIKKCLSRYQPGDTWTAAYLPIDPADLGRTYQEVIRVNSQSGKGGVAYILERDFGLQIPRWLQIEFSQLVQQRAEQQGSEISPEEVWGLFHQHYLDNNKHYQLSDYQLIRKQQENLQATLLCADKEYAINGYGDGALNAFIQGLSAHLNMTLDVTDYSEHALSKGKEAKAVAYICLSCNGQQISGVAIHHDLLSASFNAAINAINAYIARHSAAA